jgi:hypothetical protein
MEEAIWVYVNPKNDDLTQQEAYDTINNLILQDFDKMMSLILKLEPFLTTSNDKERNRATLLLATLLENQFVPFSSAQIHHLCVFFNSRLSDYPSIAPALVALRAIISNQAAGIDSKYCDIHDIFRGLFKELEVILD